MLKARILSALLMAPPALLAVYFGSPWFELMVAAAAGIMAWEWDRLCGGRFALSGMVLAAGAIAAALLGGGHPLLGLGAVLASASVLALLGVLGRLSHAAWQVAGAPYLGLPVLALTWLRAEVGYEATFWLLFVVWATDIGAYAAGRSFGGPLLAPRISPKKTWSGLAGGVLSAAVVGAVVGLMLSGAWASLAAVSGGLAVVAQGGDLVESYAKRHFGVKDASALIPGHGGLLDRVDGILTVAPTVALLLLIMGGIPGWR